VSGVDNSGESRDIRDEDKEYIIGKWSQRQGGCAMAMNKYLRLLLLIMVILNTVNIKYRNPVLLVAVPAIAIIIFILDIYLEPTRRKILMYSICAVLLALLWIALDREWINPLMFI
jgi:FtsH-binding integral membrane protein